jgi:MFS family permease
MDATIYGWYLSAQGVGGLLGGFLFGKFGKKWRSIDLLLGCLGLTGLLLCVQVNLPFIPVVLGISFLIGVVVVGWMIGLQTILQLGVDTAYLGRIIGTYGTLQLLALLTGTSAGSLLGTFWGVVPVLNIASGCLLVACVACMLYRRSFLGEQVTLQKVTLVQGSPDPQL